MTCDFPKTGINCTQTYAEAIGTDYVVYHIFFTLFASTIFIVTIFQNFRIHYYNWKDWTRRYRFKKYFLAMLLIMALMLFIQGIDPQGYNGINPSLLDVSASNLCTLIGLILVTSVVYGVHTATRINIPPWWHHSFFLVAFVVALILTIVLSILQVEESRHIYRGVKLIFYASTLTMIGIVLNWYSHNLNRIMSTLGSDVHLVELRYRLKFYITIYDIFSGFLIIYQIVAGIHSLDSDDEREVAITTDAIVFPVCQFLGIVLALNFMSRIVEQSQRDEVINYSEYRYNSKIDNELMHVSHPIPNISAQAPTISISTVHHGDS